MDKDKKQCNDNNKIINNEKLCCRCKQGKDLTHFHKNKQNKIGYNPHCIECSNRQKRKEKRICENCGKEFKINKNDDRKICQYCKISTIHKGKGNPQGKGGVKEHNLVSYDAGSNMIENSDKWVDYKKNPNKNILQVSCDGCGKGYDIKFNDIYSFIKKGTPKFLLCSDKCKQDNPLGSRNGKLGIITHFKGNGKYAGYDTYAPQIDWCEDVKKEERTNALLVKCYKCGEGFKPTKIQVLVRLNGMDSGQGNFYCSQKCKSTCETYGQINYSKELIGDGRIYSLKARSKTEENYEKYYYKINSDGLQRSNNEYHLDHKYSISEGFLNSVPIEIISHYKNLEMISAEENHKKRMKSSITLNKLYSLVEEDNGT